MASMLDKSLDDIIKETRTDKKGANRGGASGAGRGGGRGAARGSSSGAGPKPARGGGRGAGRGGRGPIAVPITRGRPIDKPARNASVPVRNKQVRNIRMMVENDVWEHDMYEVQAPRARAQPMSLETGTKLIISNLHFNVSQEDIQELFGELGDVKKATVFYDRSGRSKGTAEVIFNRKADAMAASRRYNGVRLDGQAMQIELKAGGAPSGRQLSSGISVGGRGGGGGGGGRQVVMTQHDDRNTYVERPNRNAQARPARGGGRGARGGGRGGGGQRAMRSAEDLDADLDSYHNMES